MRKHSGLALLALFAAILACTGQLANIQISDQAVYVCPTSPPLTTSVPPATATTLPGTATPTPYPTSTPYPTATPYVIRPPQDFYVGDAVYTGGFQSPASARFRLQNVQVMAASPDEGGQPRSIVTWQLEVKNVGSVAYELFPAGQMFVSTITTANGDVEGVWGPGQAAADEAGIAFDYDAYSLTPGQTSTSTLAAYIPVGQAKRFTYLLDPTQTENPNVITWINRRNPDCSGDMRDPGNGGVLPTPLS
jgi:hypothetical protein